MNHATVLRLANQHENDIEANLKAIYPNAKRQPGSGNQELSPNDIRVPHVMHVECKMTSATMIQLKYAWLKRLRLKALAFSVIGVLALRFKDRGDYYVVPADHYHHLLECEKQLNADHT